MDALDAAMAGVWIHGETAKEIGPGMIAEDMSEAIPSIVRQLNERADLFSGKT
jgi:NAD(P)H-hydrate repair Nnr-like enzyme with NAD(P)H-hydrate dehydratase domain